MLALDDIKLDLGSCQPNGSCSFEDAELNEDLCSWQNVVDGRDEFDWKFGRMKNSFFDTGPE